MEKLEKYKSELIAVKSFFLHSYWVIETKLRMFFYAFSCHMDNVMETII